MAYSGALKGNGTIVAANIRYDNVPYNITVSNNGRVISGAGTLYVEDFGQAMAIFDASTVILEIGRDRTVTLVCTQYTHPQPYIEVSTSGEIPGY